MYQYISPHTSHTYYHTTPPHTPHTLTPYTSHLTPHTPHTLIPHPHAPHLTPHLTHHTSHTTHTDTSPLTHHTHTLPLTHHTPLTQSQMLRMACQPCSRRPLHDGGGRDGTGACSGTSRPGLLSPVASRAGWSVNQIQR